MPVPTHSVFAAGGSAVVAVATPSLLTQGSENSGSDPKSTASINPTDDALVLVFLNSQILTTPGISGCGITWSHLYTLKVVDASGNVRYLHIWEGKHASPSTGSISFTAPGTRAMWQVIEIEDAEIVQASTDQNGSGTILNQSFVSGFASSLNLSLSCMASYNDSTEVEVSMTTIYDSEFVGAVGIAMHTAYKVGEETNIAYTSDFATITHAIAIFEIGPA
jgi:hypothetical protein